MRTVSITQFFQRKIFWTEDLEIKRKRVFYVKNGNESTKETRNCRKILKRETALDFIKKTQRHRKPCT